MSEKELKELKEDIKREIKEKMPYHIYVIFMNFIIQVMYKNEENFSWMDKLLYAFKKGDDMAKVNKRIKYFLARNGYELSATYPIEYRGGIIMVIYKYDEAKRNA